jgi:hypothetical protein
MDAATVRGADHHETAQLASGLVSPSSRRVHELIDHAITLGTTTPSPANFDLDACYRPADACEVIQERWGLAAVSGHHEMWWMPVVRGRIPLWIKILYSLFVCVLVPVYWREFGLPHFLWASDIALFVVLAALWLENRLLNSMMAIGVLPFELAWNLDFLTGPQLIGMASYMFDAKLPLYLRGLSLFHMMLPPVMIFMLYRLGYDRRALLAQTVLVWVILPVTYLVTDPADNINLVFGLSKEPQTYMHPLLYLILEMILLPVVICLPAHLVLQRVVGRR